ncbi:MAG: class I SAM-dependent methyltransferase [Nitrospirales bacterium]
MERREAYPTDTQHIVNLSGYVWAADQLGDLGKLRVLDIACGTGYGTHYLGTRARQVVGVDVAPVVVARNRVRYRTERVQFLVMDGTALGFRSAVFDAIISQDTIEHIQEDRRFVDEVVRVLRPGGTLVLFTPHGKVRGRRPDDPYHVREYVPAELAALLAPHFHSIRWFGRRQGDRLKAVEQHMDQVRQWDPLGVRRLIPRRVRHWLGSVVSRAQGGVELADLVPEDIEYGEGIHADTNLIAFCLK